MRVSESAEADLLSIALAAAINGDEQAFVTIYRTLQPRLLRYAISLVDQDAEDVTAEAWLQIARDLRSFSGNADAFRGWTARIVRNRALDLARARARRRAPSTSIDELFDVAAPHDTAGAAAERMSTALAVDLIASLPREQAEAVMLRAVVGLDARTAGEVLGKSAAAVRVAAHRGLRTLEKRLSAEGPGRQGETDIGPRALKP
jgi:RNA polymerase sigma-70 factor (ECF subfamily)